MSYFDDSKDMEFIDDDDAGKKQHIKSKIKSKAMQIGTVNDVNIEALIEKHRHLFKNRVTVPEKLPIGWVKHLERAFAAYVATGLELSVSKIEVDSNKFIITTSRAKIEHLKLFRKFLLEVDEICPLCGARTEATLPRARGSYREHSTNNVNLCSSCKEQHHLNNN